MLRYGLGKAEKVQALGTSSSCAPQKLDPSESRAKF
jgi:hypothetical protein